MSAAGDRPRVGVLGGTFNPVHVGHLRVAEEAAEGLGLERVVFVPSSRPPHKEAGGGDAMAPAALRLGWVRCAVRDNPRFAVDAAEVERGGTSYLVDTLPALRARWGALVFLLGRDAFAEMGGWREPARLLTLADFAVLTRPPDDGSLRDWVPRSLAADLEIAPDGRSARHRRAGTRVVQLRVTALDVSSTDIRARLRRGASVRYLLPESVREAVEASGAYGPASGGGRPEPVERAAGEGPVERRTPRRGRSV